MYEKFDFRAVKSWWVFCFWVNSDSINSSERTTVRDICLFTRVVVVLNMRKVPQVFFQPPLACFLYAALGVIVKAGTLYMSTVMSLPLLILQIPFQMSIARPSQVHVAVFFYNINYAGPMWMNIGNHLCSPAAQAQCISIILSISKKAEKRQNCVHCDKNRNIWFLLEQNPFL